MPWVIAGCVYTALALVFTWPLLAHLSSAFPHDAFDPALNAWILWWNAHALPLTERWWNAPSFWPVTGALGFSEHLLGLTILSTPLQWLGAGPVTAYNLVLLISYPLTALAAHALVFAIERRHGPALIAGLILGFSPYRVAQIPHVQMLWAFGMPLALVSAHRYVESGTRSWLAVFGAAWLMLALSNSYFLLFFPVLFAAWLLWFVAPQPRRAAALVATWAVSSLPLVPILLTYSSIHRAHNLTRRFDEIESFGADLMAIFTTAPDMVLWRPLSIAGRGEGQLFPGAIALSLVVAGVVMAAMERRPRTPMPHAIGRGIRVSLAVLASVAAAVAVSPLVVGPWRLGLGERLIASVSSPEKPLSVALALGFLALLGSATVADLWRRRSARAFYTIGGALMLAFSWGPHPKFAGTPILFRGPYSLLLALPGFSELRVPARFGMLVVLCVSVAAALAFSRLTALRTPRVRRLATALCAAGIVAESWPAVTLAWAATPIAALQRSDLTGPVIELPLGESWLDAPALFRGITHGHPVVNGYSGYAPPHYRLMSIALRLNDGDVLDGLTSQTPLVVVLNRHEEVDRWRALVEGQHAEFVAKDADFEIYRLPLNAGPPANPDVSPLPIRGIDASAGREGVGLMLDGNRDTIWNSQRVQAGGEFLIVDLGGNHFVSSIQLTSGPFISDYPRGLAIDCAADGAEWTPCWSGSVAGLLLRSLIDSPAAAAATIRLDRDGVRRIRVTQTVADPLNGWSVAELTVLGR